MDVRLKVDTANALQVLLTLRAKGFRARLSLYGQSGASQEQGQLYAKGERSWSNSDSLGLFIQVPV